VLLLNSAQLIVIGIMGEYLGRTYLESKRRPLFIVERVLRSDGANVVDEKRAPASSLPRAAGEG
jgi:polyisoprenyl-phosphate glycosyltransferase